MSIESMQFKKFSEDKENEKYLANEVYEENLCKLAERIFIDENHIGDGNTADVFTIPEMTNVCCKKLNGNVNPINSLEEEAKFLEEVGAFSDKVIIPTPVVAIEVKKHVKKRNLRGEIVQASIRENALLMKEIDGVSIEDLLEGRVENPLEFLSNFNADVFFADLGDFIDKMHQESIHHRDLHPGNIMIERGTMKPVVIDFGHAAKNHGDENIYQHNVYSRGPSGRMREITETFITDKQSLVNAKQKILEEIKILTR